MTCFICKREAVRGLTYKNKPLCTTCAPFPLQGEMMIEFSETEQDAIEKGGENAGGYLDMIGKTDLAQLSPDEWVIFLGRFLAGYSEFMRAEVKKYPPF